MIDVGRMMSTWQEKEKRAWQGKKREKSMLMCVWLTKLGHILLLSDLLASSIILLSHRDRPWSSDLWPGVSVSGISTVFWQRTISNGKCEFEFKKPSAHLLFSIKNIISECNLLQILFIAGIVFIIGMEKTYRFFFQPHKLKGTAFFLGGILIVLIKWPIIGMIVESYGAFLLFGWVKEWTICYCSH